MAGRKRSVCDVYDEARNDDLNIDSTNANASILDRGAEQSTPKRARKLRKNEPSLIDNIKQPLRELDRFGFPLDFKGTDGERLKLVTLMREESAISGSASLEAMLALLRDHRRYTSIFYLHLHRASA